MMRYGRKHRRRHPVAASHVLGAAFCEKFIGLQGEVAQMDRIEIVASLLRNDQFHAIVQRRVEPQRVDVVFRHAQQQRNTVIGTDFGKSARRIAGRSHHQHFVLVAAVQPSANRIRLRLFERAGGHPGPDLREITVERNIQIFKPKFLRKSFALVSYRRARTGQHPFDRQPFGETVNPVLLAVRDGFAAIRKRRGSATDANCCGIVERPALVFENPFRRDILQLIPGGVKIFHVS